MSKQGLASRLVWIWGVALVVLWAFMPSSAHAICEVFAKRPELSNGVVYGVGKRGPNCPSSAMLTVKLRQDRMFWPDKTLAEVTFKVRNAQLRVKHVCKGAGAKRIFAEASAPGAGSDQSARIPLNPCG